MEKDELLLEQLKVASELYRHVDDMAWRSLNYFLAVNGILVTALVGIVVALVTADGVAMWGLGLAVLLGGIGMPLLGAVISFVWCATLGRLQGYHRYRREQAKLIERNLERAKGEPLLKMYEKSLDDQGLVSVQWYNKIPARSLVVWVALVFTGLWLAVIPVLLLFALLYILFP